MTPNNELTLSDVREALKVIRKESLKKIETEWGNVEVDVGGMPVNIQLNKTTSDEFKEMWQLLKMRRMERFKI